MNKIIIFEIIKLWIRKLVQIGEIKNIKGCEALLMKEKCTNINAISIPKKNMLPENKNLQKEI